MVEIAVCIGIIGFALVAIIGILPTGLRVQQENREDTLINQDAQYLIEAIRSGSTNLPVDVLATYVDNVTTGGTTYSNFVNDREVVGLLSRPTTNRAIVRNISGPASDISQSAIAKDFAFKYQLFVQITPVVREVTLPGPPPVTVLTTNHHELTLDFRWPLLPNGGTGSGRKTFRTLVSGTLAEDPPNLWFFTPQSFTP